MLNFRNFTKFIMWCWKPSLLVVAFFIFKKVWWILLLAIFVYALIRFENRKLVIGGLAGYFLSAWILGAVAYGAWSLASGNSFLVFAEWLANPFYGPKNFIVGETAQATHISSVRGYWLVLNMAILAVAGLCYGDRIGGLTLSNLRNKIKVKSTADETHGSARWATKDEILSKNAANESGTVIAALNEDGKNCLVIDEEKRLNKNVMVLGASGTGKSYSLAITNIIHTAQHKDASMVITDPKGELHNTTAELLREQAYKVWTFNLIDMARSNSSNFLDFIGPIDRPESVNEAQIVANYFMENTKNANAPNVEDSFFYKAELSLLTALMMYVRWCLPENQQNLTSARYIARHATAEQMDYMLYDKLPEGHPARDEYGTFKNADDRLRGSILVGFGVRFQLWASPLVQQLTVDSEIDLEQIGKEKVALFCIIPDSHSTYKMLSGMFFSQLFYALMDKTAREHGGKCPVPVRLILDEINNIGSIPDLAMKMATIRSRAISAMIIAQDVGQMQARYPFQEWSSIIGQCHTTVFLGGTDTETLKYMSQRMGDSTVMSKSSRRGQFHIFGSVGQSVVRRPLMTTSELESKLGDNELILLQKGNYPARLWKAAYPGHPFADKIVETDYTKYDPASKEVTMPTIPDVPVEPPEGGNDTPTVTRENAGAETDTDTGSNDAGNTESANDEDENGTNANAAGEFMEEDIA